MNQPHRTQDLPQKAADPSSGAHSSSGTHAEPVPFAGVLDLRGTQALVRTHGYLPGPDDVAVGPTDVKRYGLRRGDLVSGLSISEHGPGGGRRNGRAAGGRRTLLRLDTVNGAEPDTTRRRSTFAALTPLYPRQRLRLETMPQAIIGRMIDIVMPIGKGQRVLIAAPPRAGKTMVLQAIADAVARNHPECHLMVVLIDERPEEVTDMRRSVRGEVIASTFDRLPADHTAVAELAVERAKRLVEGGRDVVVLLDSLTRLARAYNNAAASSGRILSGGIDAAAIYPPKRLLGAARNVEDGGSLTIIATALVENGSTGDTVIFEELKSTSNAELKLDRRMADKRIFPAIDVSPSGTRKEELLLAADERAVVSQLRRALSTLDPQTALEQLLVPLRQTTTNGEFLTLMAHTRPVPAATRRR